MSLDKTMEEVHNEMMAFVIKKTKALSFNEYQEQALATAIYPHRGSNFIYPALGLCGEAGEVAEKIKKVIRDKGGIINDDDRQSIACELGDATWYIAAICDEIGVSFEDVARINLAKLAARKAKGTLSGSGDNR